MEMFYRIKGGLIVGILSICYSCTEIYVPMLDTNDIGSLLVVEGQITDQEGPFRIGLFESVSLYSDPNMLYQAQPVSGAVIQISDNKGNVFQLYEEEGKGWYETKNKNLFGIIGDTYILNISTTDGKQYQSSPVTMVEAPDIESIHYEEIKTTYFEEYEPYEEIFLNILLDSKAPVQNDVYLRWEFEETWKFEMPSYIQVDHGMCEGCPPPTMEVVDIDYEKIFCWVTESSQKILVESTVGYHDYKVKNFVLQTISPFSDRLNIKYSILVKQYAINKELYTFFKKLNETINESGGIYSKIPGQVFGNITCSNSNEKVLGYFLASAVKTKRIFIDQFETNVDKGSAYSDCGWTTAPPPGVKIYLYGTYLENGVTREVWSTDKYCTDCRIRGTNVKPDFWE